MIPKNWMDKAECRNYPTSIFFSELKVGRGGQNNNPEIILAKSICKECPVRRECLTVFINEPHGIFGGLTEAERRILRKRKRRSVKNAA